MTKDFLKVIDENNKTHVVDKEELQTLTEQAKGVFNKHHKPTVHFERSIFINWTCGIADCKYCYLSTRPKKQKNALRSQESILAEAIVCKVMGWEVGYITGGLRVEPTKYLIELIKKLNEVLKEKSWMNFGPYPEHEILQLKPHIQGMGSAIESFDEDLHNFICPSKPLKSLMRTLTILKEQNLKKLITIILGMGEKKDDVNEVIKNIKKFNIEKLQLCFLKPQENTIFAKVPPPDMDYMAWWVAKIRVACPTTHIKVALVRERIKDFHRLLDAGANSFSRFLIFNDFNTEFAKDLEAECKKAKRKLLGNFTSFPKEENKREKKNVQKEIEKRVKDLPEPLFEEEQKKVILEKAVQYLEKLEKRVKEAKKTKSRKQEIIKE